VKLAVPLFLAGALIAQAPPYKPKPIANLRQIMRAIALPNSNIIFDVQSHPPKDEMEWKTIENAAMAIAEFSNLVAIPGRVRENGQPVPVQRADWNKFSQGLVSAGQACYKAAQSRKADAVGHCTDQLSDSCSNCHDIYRDRPQK
jgi:cytochrome c556